MGRLCLPDSRARLECGASILGLLSVLLVIGIATAVLAFTFGSVVAPGMIGIRQINFGPAQGFSADGLAPGYHWSIPFYSRIHMVPHKLRVLHLDRDPGLHNNTVGALEIQTTDGASVDVDISLITKIFSEPGKDHAGPADLIKNVGTTSDKWDNYLVKVAGDKLRRTLGNLSSSEFYNPHLRDDAMRRAFAEMHAPLAEVGMKVEAVLLRRYTYRSERIDNAIFEKNLQEQEERLNVAAGRLAEAKATVERVSAEWDAKIETLRVDGDNRAQIILSEAALYENQKRAAGDLELARASAEVDRLKASALAQSEGARIFVAREMAPLLASLKGGVVSDVDPYNLDAWMKKLGVGEGR